MARPGRPVSESYQPVGRSVSQSSSYSSDGKVLGSEDGDDQAPIFSLSKSSMDVVMATGPPHKRDPSWTRMDLRRSSSTNTHAERNSVTLQQLHPHMWQHINSTNSHQSLHSAQHADVHGPPALNERWIANMQRWSASSSGSTHSRSSTPDTVVWKGVDSRPSSLTQETPCSPVFKPSSSPTTPSPFISPLQTPTLPPKHLLTSSSSSSSTLMLSTHEQEDLVASSPKPSPLTSPLQAHTSSPLPSYSPDILQLTSTEDEGFLENTSLCFTFPSPIASSVSLAEGAVSSDAGCLVEDVIEKLQSPGGSEISESGGLRSPAQILNYLPPTSPADEQESGRGASVYHLELSSDAGCLVDDVIEKLQSPGGSEISESGGLRSPAQILNYLPPTSPADEQESGRGASVCHLELSWQPGPSFPTGRWKSPLVSSLSDSLLGDCCRCNLNAREGITRAQGFREEGTMTSQLELVDAAVQTISPVGSLWGLRRNLSNSNMGSHSLLGSPPGSRLNLKASVGSNSNLVSPSSSMFPMSSCEEEVRRGDDPPWDVNSASSHDLERKRSCLKMKIGEEDNTNGRRGSMKQVQWDEDGMTWDVHGASLDPELLSTAIQKHMELQNSPPTPGRTSKKKKAPKPPLILNVVKAIAPELHPPVMIITSTCTDAESVETPEEDGGWREVEEEGRGKKEETAEAVSKISRAEAAYVKEDDEVYGEESTTHPKSPSSGSGHSRKKSVIRSLKKPGWCGGSSKLVD